jgi:hypothetical protein
MATYDPPQPMWKRNIAGILDVVLAFAVFGIPLSKIFPSPPHAVPQFGSNTTTHELFGLGGSATLGLIVLIVAYFVVLGRTGGTVFQRLFGMTRARRPSDR